jgi:hypothetical protein
VTEDERLASVLLAEVAIPIEEPKAPEDEPEVPPEDEEAY